MEKPSWIKEKGYLHLSPSLKFGKKYDKIISLLNNKDFISKYAFFPLIHTNIKERKFKKGNLEKHQSTKRRHTHYHHKTNKPLKSAKLRPLHYATHFDSLIYSYYAYDLNEKYISRLKEIPELNNSVTAYRKISRVDNPNKGKSNIHFAKDCFDEIKRRAKKEEEVLVLAFDLEKFFSSLDHKYLKEKWAWLINEPELPRDHYNVFKSCTKFNYVLLDELKKLSGKKNYDESKLAFIRKNKGYKCFFIDTKDFKNHIKEGKLPVYRSPFTRTLANGKKVSMGIPQGLPVSAVLANLYLFDFDSSIIEKIVHELGGFYRRYSDDILIITSPDKEELIEDFVKKEIEKYKINLSIDKTEKFIFKKQKYNKLNQERLESLKITLNEDNQRIFKHKPLIYLGFEFRGYNVCIKSSNLSKYYRKTISIIKRRSKRVLKLIDVNPSTNKAIYINQLKKIYDLPPNKKVLSSREHEAKKRRSYRLKKHFNGYFFIKHSNSSNDKTTRKEATYYSYVKKCSEVFQTKSFEKQVRKRKHIAFSAITKHFSQNIKK
ncbi:hypothetical protein HX030_12645 [Myroides odoratimimus]|uniref:DNA polymerase n=1 Tax=Myroides marinus TaxID=703342 RepID=A0A165QXP5_9FLAO|nr:MULTISPECIES: reverse transcriptase domain-containing protein [Myroides]KZE77152.1 DNA polymerase [Myroides marinus]MDM1467877.1 hypothetical protein [Myroides odoratimimus]MDM1471123.1 hypothetical protein [Myroides odoratimimus]MDM1481218.1 hypothetical protein [Myroides odoratimimus]QBK77457.1 hypothetical protein E0Z07_14380 [Myroides odoratimimus]